MNRKILMVLLAVCFIVPPVYAHAAGVALVTAVKGEVTRGGQPIKIFTNVNAGDTLHAAASTQITLMFLGDQHKETVQGDTTFTVSATGTSAPSSKKSVQLAQSGLKVRGGSVTMLNSDQFGGSVKRSSGAEKVIAATSPHASLSTTPELQWTPVEGAAGYMVSIEKELGDEPFVTQTVAGTSVKLGQPLDRGRTYFWKVQAVTADGNTLGEDMAQIEVVSEQKSKSLQAARADFELARKNSPEDMSPYILMAARYVNDNLTTEAIEVLQEMAAKTPSNAYPHKRLSALYRSLGMDKEAREQDSLAARNN